MRREVGSDVDLAATRRIDPDPPRVQVELAADAARQEGLHPAIFRIADDRVSDRRHMCPQLVGASRERLQFDKRGAIAGAVDHPPASLGRKSVFVVDMHLLAAGAGLLGERRIDNALAESGTPTMIAQ